METNDNDTETETEGTKPARASTAPANPASAAAPLPPSTEDGKLCACERCPKGADRAAVPLLERAYQVPGEDEGSVVDKSHPEQLGLCEKHGGVAAEPHHRTAEEWAAILGHFPHFHPGKPPAEKPTKVMPKVWNPHYQKFASAKAFHTWPVGKELTLVEYRAAIEAAANHVYR